MKVAGHTMGTPHLNVKEAILLFEKLGLEGIEIICRDDYRCGVHPDTIQDEAKETAHLCASHNLEITCLTPYITELGSLNESLLAKEKEKMYKAVQLAHWLGCPNVRTYGGSFFPDEGNESFRRKKAVFIQALRELGSYADNHGVCLVVENHFNTLTFDAAHTVEIVSEVDSPGVGILYDQANLGFIKAETYEQSIPQQTPYIRYVHAKDFVFKDESRPFQSREVTKITTSERNVQSRVIGEGILPWPAIVKALRRIDYTGFYSLEYEYWRYPEDLPPPEIGMKKGRDMLKKYEQEIASE